MALSIITLASLSSPRSLSDSNGKDALHFVNLQGMWFVLGIIVFFGVSKIDYKKYRKKWFSNGLYSIGAILLVAVLVIGQSVNGAKRWFQLGPIRVQPSEFAKIFLILALAGCIDRISKSSKKKYRNKIKSKKMRDLSLLKGVGLYTGLYLILILFEKSFSSMLQIFILGFVLLFVSGFNLGWFSVITGVGFFGAFDIAIQAGYRSKRIQDFIANITLKSEPPYQTKQSLIAIGSGKFLGRGYGGSIQKYYFLPEIHTDYIFSGYSEEMGFIGVLLLIALYLALVIVIIITIGKARDFFAKYILTGILVMISTQIIGNIGVVSGLVPSTGIPLPLMSYGGSTTIALMISLGIVYNIIKSIYEQEEETIEEFEYEM
ncbi:MAG: FtsW/RodA/SpoVE family cell cycle protein [Leptotrichia sp.]|nr:FtsW/RodA/SpoVE family cell cycle protein [Leptotrichia sp.]